MWVRRARLKSNNKQRSLGLKWSMSEVGTPPPHNSDKPHGLVTSINNNNQRPPSISGGIVLDKRQSSPRQSRFQHLGI